jgi:hypothetical protein
MAEGRQSWWERVRGKCLQGGAGVTGVVLLDGVGFTLGDHTPCPTVPINPGDAMAAWMQTDANSFTGYPGFYD